MCATSNEIGRCIYLLRKLSLLSGFRHAQDQTGVHELRNEIQDKRGAKYLPSWQSIAAGQPEKVAAGPRTPACCRHSMVQALADSSI